MLGIACFFVLRFVCHVSSAEWDSLDDVIVGAADVPGHVVAVDNLSSVAIHQTIAHDHKLEKRTTHLDTLF